jgi:curved DNA-binding protein CbpA
MQHDYYRVLGVDPNADISVIAKAYPQVRWSAILIEAESHEQMVLVNEAWEILSNPELRQRYDEARAEPVNLSVQRAAADAKQARQQAEQYPRHWADFEVCMDGVAEDFIRAEFQPSGWGVSLSAFPKARKSLSGWLFILTGAALSWVLLILVLLFLGVSPDFFRFSPGNFSQFMIFRSLSIISIVGGGWVGAAVHQMITSAIKQSSEQAFRHGARQLEKPHQARRQHPRTEHSGESEIIICGNCSQKLRVPIRSSRLLVKCKKCQHEFYH